MTMKIATISLLFILAIIEPVVCLAVAEQSLTLNSNGKHQSISNPPVETEYIDDSMKDDTTISSIGNVGNYITLSSTMHPEEEIFECGSTENLHQGSFSYYDYAVVLGMLAISIGIGVFYGYFQKSGSSSNEFLLGSEMTIFPVTLSLTTSFITAIELLGNPSEMFYQGTQFALIVIPMVLVIPVAVRVFYPIYFKLELTSCYEYLGIRFGKDVRILGAILYIIQMSFYTAVAVLAPAIALSKATGLNTRLAVALIYLVCIFYSSQGGMKAVVIADTFQAGVLAFSLVLIVILGHFYTGGAWTIFEKSSEADRLEFFNFSANPTTRHSVFSVVIGGFFYWTSLFCTNQASVQKCMSLKSLKLAKLALGFAILGLIVVFLINFYTGLMVFTHYADCDPLRSGQIGATDQLLPFYVMDVYGSIYAITGIFVAGIFAASLGTVASALNSLAAVTCEDLLINGFNVKIRPEKGATYAKWMSLGYGTFSFVLVFVVEKLGGVLQATLTLNGLVGGVTLGLFVLGITCKKANAKGAFYGGIVALVLVIYVGVMAQMTNADVKKELPISMEKCNCYINSTLTDMPGTVHNMSLIDGLMTTVTGQELINNTKDQIEAAALTAIDGDSLSSKDTEQGYRFSDLYRISYIWYTAIGTILTIVFGLIISIVIDTIKARQILKIIQAEGRDESAVNSVVINASQKPSSKWNENMKAHYTSQQPELNGGKSGVDNFALKIDDEK